MSKTASKKLRKKERETVGFHQDSETSDNHVDSISNGSTISPLPTPSPTISIVPPSETISSQSSSPQSIPSIVSQPNLVTTTTSSSSFIPPPGPAGDLLAILLSTSSNSSLNGNSHTPPAPATLPSSNHVSSIPSSGKSILTNHSDQQPAASSYFKSKSGFAIRL